MARRKDTRAFRLAIRFRVQGMTLERIALKTGKSIPTVIKWLKDPSINWKAERAAEAVRLRACGWTYQKIGERLGMSRWTVSRRCRPVFKKAQLKDTIAFLESRGACCLKCYVLKAIESCECQAD